MVIYITGGGCGWNLIPTPLVSVINPQRTYARVTVLGLSVCVFFLFWHLTQSGVQTAVSAIQRDTGMKYKKGFFLKTIRSEVMA